MSKESRGQIVYTDPSRALRVRNSRVAAGTTMAVIGGIMLVVTLVGLSGFLASTLFAIGLIVVGAKWAIGRRG